MGILGASGEAFKLQFVLKNEYGHDCCRDAPDCGVKAADVVQ